MANDLTNDQKRAYQLVKMLSAEQLAALVALVKTMVDPVACAIVDAPIDGELLTAEEVKALEESREWSKNNPGIPHEQVLAELGISVNEITDETAAEIDQARESLARGEGIPHDEILREFGMKK